jgi:nucleoid-associated protein YgaU
MRAVRIVVPVLLAIVAWGGPIQPAGAEPAAAPAQSHDDNDWLVTRWLETAAERYQSEIAGPLSARQSGPPVSTEVSRFAKELGRGVRGCNDWIRFWGQHVIEAYNVQVAGTFTWLPALPDWKDARANADRDAKAFTEARRKADAAWQTAEMTGRDRPAASADAADAAKKKAEADIRAREAEAKDKLAKKKQELDKRIDDGLKKLEEFEKTEKARKAEEQRKAQEAKKEAEALKRAEEVRKAEHAKKAAEDLRVAQQTYVAQVAQAEKSRKAAEEHEAVEARRRADEARAAEVARVKAEADRKAEEARKAAEAEQRAREKYVAEVAEAEKTRLLREQREAEEEKAKAELARKADEDRKAEQAKIAQAASESRKPAVANAASGVGAPPRPATVAPNVQSDAQSVAEKPAATEKPPQRMAAADLVSKDARPKAYARKKSASQSGSKHEAVAKPKRSAKVAARKRLAGTYVVRRGDTLWKIARRYYKTGQRYAAVYRANRHTIRDPDLIYPGQVIRVPRA